MTEFVPDRRRSYENRRVAYLLKHLVPDEGERAEWAARLRERTRPYLTFDALYRDFRAYGRPPVYFNVAYVSGRDDKFDGSYWLNLSNNGLVSYYFVRRHALWTRLGAQIDFAQVVNVPTVWGGAVVHTVAHAPCDAADTVVRGRGLNDDGRYEPVVVQPYNSFARWVATRWRNKQPLAVPRPSTAELARGMPASAVLLLLHLWERAASDDGRVRTTHERLAERSGLTLSTVKRSLKALGDRDLIETERGENGVSIRVV